jgi:hypothetical protein
MYTRDAPGAMAMPLARPLMLGRSAARPPALCALPRARWEASYWFLERLATGVHPRQN